MSEDRKMSRRDEIEALLPFYLNGTLSGEDLRNVEDWLANDPNAEAALAEAEDELAFISKDNEQLRPDSQAFRRFSEALEQEAGPRVSPASRLYTWFSKTFAVPAPLVWASAAAVLALMVVSTDNLRNPQGGDNELAGADTAGNAPFVLVTFNPGAKLSEIAALLAASGGRIIDGPGPGGVYKIAISAATISEYDELAGGLSKSPLVDQLIAGRKPNAAQ